MWKFWRFEDDAVPKYGHTGYVVNLRWIMRRALLLTTFAVGILGNVPLSEAQHEGHEPKGPLAGSREKCWSARFRCGRESESSMKR